MNRKILLIFVIIVATIASACDALPGGGTDPSTDGTPVAGENTRVPAGETDEPTPTATPQTVIVVAIQDIPRGIVITPDMVADKPVPAEFAPTSAFTSVDDVIGLIAATDIVREEVLLARKLVQDFNSLGSVGSAAAAVLEPGRVAIAVPMDRLTSVAYAIQPGDHVDIIISMLFVDVDTDSQTILPNNFRLISGETDEETGTTTLTVGSPNAGELDSRTLIVPVVGAQLSANFSVLIEPSERQRPRLLSVRTVTDAQVIWVGEFPANGEIFQPAPPPTAIPVATEEVETTGDGEATPVNTPLPPRPTIVTLAVSPQQAVILTYMVEAGTPMTFVLRSARAQGLPNTDPVTLSYIMSRYGVVPPDRFNYTIEPAIRSIRGITLEDIGGPDETEEGQ